MRKSMLLITGSIAAVILSGCASDGVSVSRWDNNSPSQPVDNRDGLERQGFVRTGATEYVKPNAYGLGTGMNQFGEPVKVVPAY